MSRITVKKAGSSFHTARSGCVSTELPHGIYFSVLALSEVIICGGTQRSDSDIGIYGNEVVACVVVGREGRSN